MVMPAVAGIAGIDSLALDVQSNATVIGEALLPLPPTVKAEVIVPHRVIVFPLSRSSRCRWLWRSHNWSRWRETRG